MPIFCIQLTVCELFRYGGVHVHKCVHGVLYTLIWGHSLSSKLASAEAYSCSSMKSDLIPRVESYVLVYVPSSSLVYMNSIFSGLKSILKLVRISGMASGYGVCHVHKCVHRIPYQDLSRLIQATKSARGIAVVSIWTPKSFMLSEGKCMSIASADRRNIRVKAFQFQLVSFILSLYYIWYIYPKTRTVHQYVSVDGVFRMSITLGSALFLIVSVPYR